MGAGKVVRIVCSNFSFALGLLCTRAYRGLPDMNRPYEYITDLFHKLREDISAIKHRLFTEKPKQEASADRPRHYTINAATPQIQTPTKKMGNPYELLSIFPPTISIDAQTQVRPKKLYRDRGRVASNCGNPRRSYP